MKIDANVKFVIDDDMLNINIDKVIKVPVDMDYVEANEDDIYQWIETELNDRYGVHLVHDEDFVVTNMQDIIEDISFDEFQDKTEYSNY